MSACLMMKNVMQLAIQLWRIDRQLCLELTEVPHWIDHRFHIIDTEDHAVCSLSYLLECTRLSFDRRTQKIRLEHPVKLDDGVQVEELDPDGCKVYQRYLKSRTDALKDHLVWNVNDTGISLDRVLEFTK